MLPDMVHADGIRKYGQTRFGGYDHRLAAGASLPILTDAVGVSMGRLASEAMTTGWPPETGRFGT